MECKTVAPSMDWDSRDLSNSFKKFKDHTRFMFNGPLATKTEEVKCNYLMLWIGEKGRQIYATWKLSEEESTQLNTLYTKFEEYCKPKSNIIYNRYLLRTRVQNENETLEQFVTDLKTLLNDCQYQEELHDEIVRDHIVFGVRSSKIREKLIMEGSDLTLTKCIDIAHTLELGQSQAQAIGGTPEPVHAVRQKGARKFEQRQNSETCGRCGSRNHKRQNECPAKSQECRKCKRKGHYAKMCKTRNIHDVQEENEETADFYVHTVSTSRPDQLFVNILLGVSDHNTEVRCKVDTGAQINCIPMHTFKKLNCTFPLEPSRTLLTSYSGDRLKVHGKVNLTCQYKERTTKTDFFVVESSAQPLLSLQTSLDLGLLKLTYSVDNGQTHLEKNDVMQEYGDLFDGIGMFSGTCTLHLKENAIPVVCPPRKVPYGLQDKLKTELDSMEAKGIICKVTEPTEWVNSLICVEKPNGKLRVCLDPKALNDNIRRPHYPMRTIDDITSKLTGAKYFSVLDATKGYWSVKLDEKSSYLTTFNSPFCRYRYLRLPMGIRSSQDIFNRKIDETFEGLTGVTSIVDDILVWGKTRSEHDSNLKRVLDEAREAGLRFNPDKCKVGLTEVKFYGHICSSDGLKADPEKISAILKMKEPGSRAELETILGMITYLTKFAPNLAEITSPLRELLRKDVEFRWDSQQAEAFSRVKSVITQAPVLTYYDSSKPVRLQVDASSKGLGVCCLQDGKPVAYASKTLTKSEISYAQIEKETLAILFGCTRFKHYIYGRHTVVESDCKPVVAIMKKPLCSAPPRLQRLLLQLQDFDIDVIHCRGKDIPLGDALSRNFVKDTFPDLIQGLDAHVHTVLKSLPVSDARIQSIVDETQTDGQLQTLVNVIVSGWPDERKLCPKSILEFWNHRDELSYQNGIVFKGQKLVIPQSLRQSMIEAMHVGHFGVEKTTGRARDIMFWPSMTKQISDFVLACDICNRYRDSNTKEPLHQHETPHRPWQNLSCDIFTWNNQEYMVTVDAYSRYFEIDQLPKTTSKIIIQRLKVHFSRFGFPDTLKTDNGAYYTSEEFQNFTKKYNIRHMTSSPRHASSNGLAEIYVKIAKRILQKSKDGNTDPYVPLLEYRNTPLKCGFSPVQLLMGRRTKSILPVTNSQLMPQNVNHKTARNKMIEQQIKTKTYFDKTARKLPSINVGQNVRVQRNKLWEPGKIISQHNDHSFNVQTPDGSIYRRNRVFINDSKQQAISSKPDMPNQPPLKPVSTSPIKPQSRDETSIKSPMINSEESGKSVIRTRSGREVKPVKLYSGEEWTK